MKKQIPRPLFSPNASFHKTELLLIIELNKILKTPSSLGVLVCIELFCRKFGGFILPISSMTFHRVLTNQTILYQKFRMLFTGCGEREVWKVCCLSISELLMAPCREEGRYSTPNGKYVVGKVGFQRQILAAVDKKSVL
jgi:hypothetical protein